MARLSLKPLVGAVLVSLCAMPAYALNLLEAYQAAKQNDPTYRAAMAEQAFTEYFGQRPDSDLRRITREDVPHHVIPFMP